MKSVLTFFSVCLLLVAALSTPIAIFFGLYDWVVMDVEFKVALFGGFILWLKLVAGVIIGYPMFIYSQSIK